LFVSFIGLRFAFTLYFRRGYSGNTLLLGLPYRLGIVAQMELRHLRYFVAVAEEQNVTRAAVRLHVSQPPLSRQIQNLEDELGIALFNRDANALRLTEAGRTFLTEARLILQRAERATQMAKDVAGGKRGEIHIGFAIIDGRIVATRIKILPKIKPRRACAIA
jgi:DNA-binding transcriptional LysR family regulator